MAFQNPVVSPLNSGQELTLAKLTSLRNILSLPVKDQIQIAAAKQISSFEYLLKIAKSAISQAFVDIIIKKFIDTIFDPNNDKLERLILSSLAKSLDTQKKHISKNPKISNDKWLVDNALPALHIIFQEVKVLIVKQLIAMIFGPKDKMTYAQPQLTNPPPFPNTSETLEDVLAAESMFSLTTAEGNQYGDMEFNVVQLRKELEEGIVQFTISCQDIKIKLPDNFDQEIDDMQKSILMTIPGVLGPGTPGKIKNPTVAFDYIGNHVANETTRINSQENANAIEKSWFETLLEKLFNLLMISLTPYLLTLLTRINGENPALNLTIGVIISSPLQLKNLEKSDPKEFDAKSIFMKNFLNAMYALLLSILLKAIIKEIKKLIKNALAKRAAMKLQNKLKSFRKLRKGLDVVNKIEKVTKAVQSLKELNGIFNYNKT